MAAAARRAFPAALVKSEKVLPDCGYSIDLTVDLRPAGGGVGGGVGWLPGKDMVLVELDGKSHYCAGGREPLGRTVLKHRQLRERGWMLAVVPWHEWDSVGPGKEGEEDYIRRVVEEAAQCDRRVGSSPHS